MFFFILSLALIGFIPMLQNTVLLIWSYSVYLTLREWAVILYIVLIITCIITALQYEYYYDKYIS